MATYAVTNVTTQKTSGPVGSLEQAHEAMPRLLEDGHEYQIVEMTNPQAGAGAEIEHGWFTKS